MIAPTAPIGALTLRLILVGYWAVQWWYKVGFRGMPVTESFFASLGLPAWLAWFDISFEVVVIALLLTGVLFRFACLASLPILFASMIIFSKDGFYFPTGGIELPILWALVQASLVLVGPGALTIETPVKAGKGLVGWLFSSDPRPLPLQPDRRP
jgi:putative oxidoreductase